MIFICPKPRNHIQIKSQRHQQHQNHRRHTQIQSRQRRKTKQNSENKNWKKTLKILGIFGTVVLVAVTPIVVFKDKIKSLFSSKKIVKTPACKVKTSAL